MSKKSQKATETTDEQSAQAGAEDTNETVTQDGAGEGEGNAEGADAAPEVQPEQPQAPAATVRMKSEVVSHISHDGAEYVADKDGVFDIDTAHAAAFAEAFGLTYAD